MWDNDIPIFNLILLIDCFCNWRKQTFMVKTQITELIRDVGGDSKFWNEAINPQTT